MENLVPKAELSSLTDTEFIAENVTVHGKNCISCLRWGKEIMVSFMDENKKYESGIGKCFDLLLTMEQAINLRDRLTEELERNNK